MMTQTKNNNTLKKLHSNNNYYEVAMRYAPMGISYEIVAEDHSTGVKVSTDGWQKEATSYQVKKAIDHLERLHRVFGSDMSDEKFQVAVTADDIEKRSEPVLIGEVHHLWPKLKEEALRKVSADIVSND